MSTPLEKTRAMQAMLFQTEGGESFRELLIQAGHFQSELENDEHRIEQNLVKRLMQACGVTLEFKAKSLPDSTEESNLIDNLLEDTPDV